MSDRCDMKEIEQDILKRNKEIEELRRQLQKFVIWDDIQMVILDMDHWDEAAEICEKMLELKETNEAMNAIIQKYREIINKYDFTGQYFPDPDIIDLETAEQNARNDLASLREGIANSNEKRGIERIIEQIQMAQDEIGEFFTMYRTDFEIVQMVKGDLVGSGYGLRLSPKQQSKPGSGGNPSGNKKFNEIIKMKEIRSKNLQDFVKL